MVEIAFLIYNRDDDYKDSETGPAHIRPEQAQDKWDLWIEKGNELKVPFLPRNLFTVDGFQKKENQLSSMM